MLKQNLVYKDAFFNFDENKLSWSFGNKYFENILFFNEIHGLKHLCLRQLDSGFAFTSSQKSAIFSLLINFKKLTGEDFCIKSWSSYKGDREDIFLVIKARCKVFKLDVAITFRVVSTSTGFQQWLTLKSYEEDLMSVFISQHNCAKRTCVMVRIPQLTSGTCIYVIPLTPME